MAFSKSLTKGQIPVGCQLCEGGNKIEWKCTDCSLLMCDRCKDRVHLRIAKDHKTVKIKDLGEQEDSWERFVFSDLNCRDHPNQSCSLYCKSCSKVICLKCIIKVHNGHTFVDEEEFDDKKEKMKDGQKKAEQYLRKLISAKEMIMAPDETENRKLKILKQNILDQKKKLHKVVDDYADNLFQDVDQHYETLKQKEETKIEQEIKKMHTKNETVGSIITSKDFIQFFSDFDKLNVSLNEDMSNETMNVFSLPTFVPGELSLSNFGTLECRRRLTENQSQVKFKVTNQWTTKLTNIHYIVRYSDGTLWIADNLNKELHHIELKKDSTEVLSSFSITVFGIAELLGNMLVSTGEAILQLINVRTKKITDSVFNVAPFISRDVVTTADKKVIITARSPGLPLNATGRSVIFVMDQSGNRLIEYDHDRDNKSLFTLPYKVTSTSDGNICVVDTTGVGKRGRIIVISPKKITEGIYTGHHEVNTEDKPFSPSGILSTPCDFIIAIDKDNHVLHILNNGGYFVSHCNVCNIGIKYPYCLALSKPDHLYIGCKGSTDCPENAGTNVYEVEYSGI